MFNIKHDYTIDAHHEKSCVKIYTNLHNTTNNNNNNNKKLREQRISVK
jgi:hypothetical protein